jgi:hypothetical protein
MLFSFLGTSLIHTTCPDFPSVLATVGLIWRLVLLRDEDTKIWTTTTKEMYIVLICMKPFVILLILRESMTLQIFVENVLKDQILEPNDPWIQYLKYCDISCPDLQLSILWFYQNSPIVQIFNIQEGIFMRDLLRLQISSNFLFYIFINIEIFISFVCLLCRKLQFLYLRISIIHWNLLGKNFMHIGYVNPQLYQC